MADIYFQAQVLVRLNLPEITFFIFFLSPDLPFMNGCIVSVMSTHLIT